MQEVLTADDDDTNTEVKVAEDEESEDARPPSPLFNEVDPEEPEHLEATVRLDGDMRLPAGLLPSFRYKWIGYVSVLFLGL